MKSTFEKVLKMGNSASPRPFPGRYPTRIRILSFGAVPFDYAGKPVPELLSLVRNAYILKNGHLNQLSFIEFDLNGIIYNSSQDRPALGFFPLYYPTPSFVFSQGHSMLYKLFMLLDRRVRQIGTSRIYIPNHVIGKPYEPWFMSRMSKASRRIVPASSAPPNRQHREDWTNDLFHLTTAWNQRPARRPQPLRAMIPQNMAAPRPAIDALLGQAEVINRFREAFIRNVEGQGNAALARVRGMQNMNPTPNQVTMIADPMRQQQVGNRWAFDVETNTPEGNHADPVFVNTGRWVV